MLLFSFVLILLLAVKLILLLPAADRFVFRFVTFFFRFAEEHLKGGHVVFGASGLSGRAERFLVDPLLAHKHLVNGLGSWVVDVAHLGSLLYRVALNVDKIE